MKKIYFFLLPLVAVLLTGCFGVNKAMYPNYAQERTMVNVDLNSNNFRVVGIVTGESEVRAVLGIMNKSRMETWCKTSALAKMYENAHLQGSQKIIDVNCFASIRHTPFVNRWYAKATGVVIEFVEPGTGNIYVSKQNTDTIVGTLDMTTTNKTEFTTTVESILNPKSPVVFKDNIFKNITLTQCANNRNKVLTNEEASEVKKLVCNNCGITDFTGIESFVNLEELAISGNKCAVIDLTNNKQLKSIKVASSSLKKVILDKNCTATIDVDESLIERR